MDTTGGLSESINQIKTKCEEIEILVEKRIKIKRKLPEEKEDDVCQTLVQEVKINLFPVHLQVDYDNRLVNKLEVRFASISYLQTVGHIVLGETSWKKNYFGTYLARWPCSKAMRVCIWGGVSFNLVYLYLPRLA